MILDRDYLLKDVVPVLTKQISEGSIYEYFEDELQLTIAYAQKEITVEPVTAAIEEAMDLNGDQYVVVVERLSPFRGYELFRIYRIDPSFRQISLCRVCKKTKSISL